MKGSSAQNVEVHTGRLGPISFAHANLGRDLRASEAVGTNLSASTYLRTRRVAVIRTLRSKLFNCAYDLRQFLSVCVGHNDLYADHQYYTR